MKKQNGITMVTIVVTIIGLIVLAGITYLVLTGENGIISKSKNAKKNAQEAKARDLIEIAWKNSVLKNYDINSGNVKKSLNNLIDSGEVKRVNIVENNYEITYVDDKQNTKYIFTMNNDGKIIDTKTIDLKSGDVKTQELKVGDYVNYIPDVAEVYTWDSSVSGYSFGGTMSQEAVSKWRVFKIDGDRVELISDSPTSEDIILTESDAYNNGVWLLNDMCKCLWSKSGFGVARSININDINSVSNYDKTKFSNGQFKYGDIQKFSNNMKYPNLFVYEDISKNNTFNIGNIKESESLLKEDGTPNVITGSSSTGVNTKQTYYSYGSSTIENETIRNILFQSVSYLLASRYVDVTDNVEFGLRGVLNGGVGKYGLLSTGIYYEYIKSAVRPIVELNENVKIDMDSGDGTEKSPYDLSY